MDGEPSENVVHVPLAQLAVLPASFERDLTAPWQRTRLRDSDGVASSVGAQLKLAKAHFLSFSPRFAKIIGKNPRVKVLAEKAYEFAHEGPVHLPETNEVFFTSNRLCNDSSGNQQVELHAVDISTGGLRRIQPATPVPLANGAFQYPGGIALLAQGMGKEIPGGVLLLNPTTGEWDWLLNNWFGLHFNSPNDIVVSKDGALWFTDPTYGCHQGFKGIPQLGEYVWRYLPGEAPARVVADGFHRPNGLCLSSDGKTMYVSDTGFASGAANEPPDPLKPHTIYAFDVLDRNGGQFLGNRRVFAVADNGIPDGLKTDLNGNVYSGCGDGLNIWAADGSLIGKIVVEGGVANFVFAGNDLIMLAERRILKLHLLCKGDCQ